MMNVPMLMTISAHQASVDLIQDFHKNPKLFSGGNSGRSDTFCHMSAFGALSHRLNGLDDNCNEVTSYRHLRQELHVHVENPEVKEIFIEFDGHGGEGAGCFDFATYIRAMAERKPIIGFINGNCFSAHFGLASACSSLYMTEHSFGGSIGAILGRPEVTSPTLKMTYFKSGEAKGDGAPLTKLEQAESDRLTTKVNDIGYSFCKLVADHRGIDADAVHNLQANIFDAQTLLEHGLIDGIKTEEEIKTMMRDSTHNTIVEGINTKHAEEVTKLNTTHQAEISLLTGSNTELETKVEAGKAEKLELTKQINQLANSAGMPELGGKLIEQGATLETAAEQIKLAAADKDEELLLTSGLDSGDNGSFDMEQLIKDA